MRHSIVGQREVDQNPRRATNGESTMSFSSLSRRNLLLATATCSMRIQIPAKTMLALMLYAGLSYPTVAGGAERNAVGKAEIEHLLTRLEVSNCRFQRNGSWYMAAQARTHLAKKYQYLLDKQLLGSAEDFVSGCATKSSMTGKLYWVQCGAQEPVRSAAWMATQLLEVRASAKRKTSSKARDNMTIA